MQLKKPKNQRKPSRKKLVNKLDKVFELYIRHRDKWTCFTCGVCLPDNVTDMHAGHLISRKQYSTRWNENNVFAQCKNCNFTHVWRPHIYTDIYIQRFGADKYHELVQMSHQVIKASNNALEMLCLDYQCKLNDLKPNLSV